MSDTAALYHKYRSQDFSELIGQEHITTTLDTALSRNHVSHAYLFTGPRGTGKTSAARIFARRVNGLESGSNEAVDIIEIDAASNNGVDEIRDLREKINVAPNYHDYKVYIIDEVHMLSAAAFNALLKTLEEPPAHAIFILATTEPHKLPQTIISRTQHFPFRLIPRDILQDHLKYVVKQEKIAIDDAALELIAQLGEGSVRDSLSMLDQLLHGSEKITVENVRSMIGFAHYDHVRQLKDATLAGDTRALVRTLDELLDTGVAPRQLLKQLLEVTREHIRSYIEANETENSSAYKARKLLRTLCDIPASTADMAIALEGALLEVCQSGKQSDVNGKKPEKEFRQRVADKPQTNTKKQRKAKPRQATKQSNDSQLSVKKTPSQEQATDTLWIDTLSRVKSSNASLYGLLRNTHAEMDDDTCTLTARFQFHYRRLQEAKVQSAIESALSAAAGHPIKLVVSREEGSAETPPAQQTVSYPENNVLDILGGEVIRG